MRHCAGGLLGTALLWLACVLVGAKADTTPKPKFEMSPQEKELLELTNKERAKHNLPPLKPNPLLFKAARAHSANMGKHGEMEHILDGKTPFQRIKATGYEYRYAGENIAWGDNLPMTEIVQAWMDSKRHRENLLSPRYTETGLGRVVDPKDKNVFWYTQVFARPQQR